MFRVQAQAFSPGAHAPANAGEFRLQSRWRFRLQYRWRFRLQYIQYRCTRTRWGFRQRDHRPAKRAPPVSRAALSAAQNPSPVALLQQAARMMGFSLADGPGQGPDAAVELAPAPTLERRPQDIPPAALGAPPGGGNFSGARTYTPCPYMMWIRSPPFRDPLLTTAADPEATAADLRLGDKAQTLLRKYLPQFYCTDQGSEGQAETPASLLFRGRADSGAGIPLTDDFQQEYARISREPKLSTPLRSAEVL